MYERFNNNIENYKNQLYNAFLEYDKLYKLKYGDKAKIKLTNLFNSQDVNNLEKLDHQIILSLELLQTFLDIYIYHKEHNVIEYEDISNILKYRKIEIIKDKQVIQNKRFEQISNCGYDIYKNEKKKNIIYKIYLKIDLKDKENRDNEINIEFNRTLTLEKGIKLIKLIDGDLALLTIYYNNKSKISFIKNLKKEYYLLFENRIIDFIQLENGNLSILFDNKIEIYINEKKYFIKNKK